MISIIQEIPAPFIPPKGNIIPSNALAPSFVGFPYLSKARPYGIFFPLLAANFNFPLATAEQAMSNINGLFLFAVGAPKANGAVPKCAAIAP